MDVFGVKKIAASGRFRQSGDHQISVTTST
jgi:hypothetical protein